MACETSFFLQHLSEGLKIQTPDQLVLARHSKMQAGVSRTGRLYTSLISQLLIDSITYKLIDTTTYMLIHLLHQQQLHHLHERFTHIGLCHQPCKVNTTGKM